MVLIIPLVIHLSDAFKRYHMRQGEEYEELIVCIERGIQLSVSLKVDLATALLKMAAVEVIDRSVDGLRGKLLVERLAVAFARCKRGPSAPAIAP